VGFRCDHIGYTLGLDLNNGIIDLDSGCDLFELSLIYAWLNTLLGAKLTLQEHNAWVEVSSLQVINCLSVALQVGLFLA